ncbi:MAG: glycosyltransferase [Chitinophagaceae bacterium]
MNIGVSARWLLKNKSTGTGLFVQEVVSNLITQHQKHHFFLFFEEPCSLTFPGHVKAVVLPPAAINPLLWKYWFDIKIPRALKKYKIDILLNFDGCVSLQTKVPQFLLIHGFQFDRSFTWHKLSQRIFYKLYLPQLLRKATLLFVTTPFIQEQLINQYKLSPAKIRVVYTGLPEIFRPCEPEVRTGVKEAFADGKEYFLIRQAVATPLLINLLKGFSLFKKRQRSNWKLLVSQQTSTSNMQLKKLLPTYKYRDDIVFTGMVDAAEEAKIVGSAYAVVCFSTPGDSANLLEVFQCAVPCLVPAGERLPDTDNAAVLSFDPANPTDIADKLMQIYKDESLRTVLAQKAINTAALYTWQRTAGLIWDGIEDSL